MCKKSPVHSETAANAVPQYALRQSVFHPLSHTTSGCPCYLLFTYTGVANSHSKSVASPRISIQQQEKFSHCLGFGWNLINCLHSSWYGAVFWTSFMKIAVIAHQCFSYYKGVDTQSQGLFCFFGCECLGLPIGNVNTVQETNKTPLHHPV